MSSEYLDLESLGKSAKDNKNSYRFEGPDPSVLECFESPHEADDEFKVTAFVEEFTSLCPVTNQPDYGTLCITYTPGSKCIESKSLKLYLLGYRNYGAFCETVAKMVMDDLVEILGPVDITVTCDFASRGGIGFSSTASYPRHSF